MNAAVLQDFACYSESTSPVMRAASLPPQVFGLGIDSFRSIFEVCQLFEKKTIFHLEKSRLQEMLEGHRRAARILSSFPNGVMTVVQMSLPAQLEGRSAYLYVHRIFGRLWRVLLFERSDQAALDFLRKSFVDALTSAWQGPFATNEYDLNVPFRSKWVSKWNAKKFLSTFMHTAPVDELVKRGEIEALYVWGKARNELWVKRESLERWAQEQKEVLARYVTITSARQQLGLSFKTMQALVDASIITIYGTKRIRGHHHGRYVLKAQIETILSAFNNDPVLEVNDYKVGETMSLGDAMWGLIGRRKGLPLAIRAVQEGTLKSLGRTRKFRGILGYIFRTVDLARFSRMPENRTPHVARDVPLILKKVAELLNLSERSVSELLRLGKLKYFVGHRARGRLVLISGTSVDAFSLRFVRACDAAERLSPGNTDANRVLLNFRIPVVRFGSRRPGAGTFVRRDVWEKKMGQITANVIAA